MRLLLTTLNSKYVHSNLALKYLFSVAAASCDFIAVKEFTINNSEDYVFSEILAGEYDVICFSCYVWNIRETTRLAENIKKVKPDAAIIFGGPETGYETAEFMLAHSYVDFVVMGEGEYTFSRLAHALALEDFTYEKIKGLAFRRNGEVFVNRAAELLVLDSIPFPYNLMPWEKDKVIYYESSRGCPYGCVYCMSSLERKVRALPLERVFREVWYFLLNNALQVKFIDRAFNWDKRRANEIIMYIISRDNGRTNFHFEICGELVDDTFIDILSGARDGLFRFEVGVQSTNKKALAAVKRSVGVEKLISGVRKLTSLENIHVHVDLIAGLPYEDYYSFKKSFNDAYNLAANTVQLGFLKLLKGTGMRSMARDFDYEFKAEAPYEIISSRFLSAVDICRLKQIEEMIGFFHNRGGFERALKYAVNIFADTAFDFYEEFSFFYSLKGFHHKPHKKEDLYRIFYEYALWKCRRLGISSGEFLELLAMDMGDFLNPEAVKKFEKTGWRYVY